MNTSLSPEQIHANFDAAVKTLNTAITGSNAAGVADAFGAMAAAAASLAEAVAAQDAAAPATSTARVRGAA